MKHFVLSIRSVTRQSLDALSVDDCRALALRCRDLLRQVEAVPADPQSRARAKRILSKRLVAAWNKAKAHAL